MSGPAYPAPPKAGDNAIGKFAIGVSSIGSLPDFNVDDTIVSQYANSDVLRAIIHSFSDAIDTTVTFEQFHDFIFNLPTAVGLGLDILGRIVGVNRALHISNSGKYLGFVEGGTLDYDPWNQSPWYLGAPLTTNYNLPDDVFRRLIFAKAISNISDGSTASINAILRAVFPARGNVYVVDNLDMSMTYTFDFSLTDVDAAVIFQTGILPKPAGVSATLAFNV